MPSMVWAAIAARTRAEPAAAAPRAGPASGPQAVPAGARWAPWRWGLGGAMAAGAAAFALVAVAPQLVVSPERAAMQSGQKLPPSYVGLLTDAGGNGKYLVSSLRHGDTLTVKVIGPVAAPAAGQYLVLWAQPAEGAPFALGPVPASGSISRQLPASSEQLFATVGKLMVSLETSPQPAVPGSVIYSGNCARLW